MSTPECWWVYLLECGNGCYYTGASADVAARFALHCAGHAAKYTRRFGVRRLVSAVPIGTRAEAMREERRIKAMRPDTRLAYFARRGAPGLGLSSEHRPVNRPRAKADESSEEARQAIAEWLVRIAP